MRIFCSGIGGIGLSGYAAHMRARGHDVSGSDKSDSPLIADLKRQGIAVSLNQDGSALPKECDLLVYSEAIPESAPERAIAAKRGIRQISYFAGVGELTKDMKLIAVCGTHGKSSTTAMAARVLIELGLDPNVIVGTKLKELDGRNWRVGKSDLWIVEACEYRRSFLYLSPSIVLLTNADGDHFDAFTSQEDYEHAFAEFLGRLPKNGVVITHGGDPQVRRIAEASGRKMIDADREPLITLGTPGVHMQQNAQLVLALAKHLEIDSGKAQKALSGYSGAWRRMEVKGTFGSGITVIDDYGHHPTEIQATLKAIRSAYPGRRIVCVFQPHTHDRTIKLWDAFTASFSDADVIVLTDVYDARPTIEKDRVDIRKLADAIATKSGKTCTPGSGGLDAARKMLDQVLMPSDVVVTMGAGTITTLADAILDSA